MNKQTAIKECKKHWQFILETGKEKTCYEPRNDWFGGCAFCQFASRGCLQCPAYEKWPVLYSKRRVSTCMKRDSVFKKYYKPYHPAKLAKCARRIIKLCDELLEELNDEKT